VEDLDAILAEKHAQIAAAENKLRVTREESETLLSHAKAIKAQAEADAAAILAEARELAQTALAAAGIR
jgi:hypothetical protein